MSSAMLSAYLDTVRQGPEERVLRLLVHLAGQAVEADECYLLALDGGSLVFSVGDSDEHDRALEGRRVPVGEGLAGMAALALESVVGRPIPGEQSADRACLGLAAPMLVGESLYGTMLGLTADPARTFSPVQILQFSRICAVAALVLEQRSHLKAVRFLQRDQPALEGRLNADNLSYEIAREVGRLATIAPARLEHVLTLLRTIEKLCE